jgi:hypothetical protein
MSESPEPTTSRQSPFSEPSFEPRFALDHDSPDPAVLAIGLELQQRSQRPWGGGPVFTAYRIGTDRLAVSANAYGFPHPLHQPVAFEGLTRDQAALWIARWLEEEAEYSEAPWFDGGEGRGFRMYHVPWKQEPRQFYGYLLVEPKWFEIHK